jgi:hypothetical protein
MWEDAGVVEKGEGFVAFSFEEKGWDTVFCIILDQGTG